jgi:nitric oxide synthase-interacting protein
MQKELDVRIQEEEEERLRLEAEAQQRAIQDFELLQMGLEIKTKEAGKQLANRTTIIGRQNGKLVVEEEETPAGGSGSSSGKKRKFELDEEELMSIAKEETQRAKKILTEEKVKRLRLGCYKQANVRWTECERSQ